MRLLATSKLDDVADVAGVEFGTHNVGPTPDPTSNDLTIRGGCLESVQPHQHAYFLPPTLSNNKGSIIVVLIVDFCKFDFSSGFMQYM